MAALITLTGVSKDYVGGGGVVHALREVDLVIERGEFVAVVGQSGSGKSTLMNILGCLDRPTKGTYELADIEVGGRSNDGRALVRNHLIGFIFQGFNLLPRTTALENVELPLQYRGVPVRERRARAKASLAAVNLADRMDHTPNQLSGGQQQRVAIARALVSDPPLLLADEPTGNLDTRTSLEVLALLQRLNRELGITICLVTHEQDIAACANRVISFRDGRMVSDVRQATPHDAAGELAALPPPEVSTETEDAHDAHAHEAHAARSPVPWTAYLGMLLGWAIGMLVGYMYCATILGHQSAPVRIGFAVVVQAWLAARFAHSKLDHPLSTSQRLRLVTNYTGVELALIGIGVVVAVALNKLPRTIFADAHIGSIVAIQLLVVAAIVLARYLLLMLFSTKRPARREAHT